MNELVSQLESSEIFLADRLLRETDEAKRRKLGAEYAHCVAQKARARILRYGTKPEISE